MTTQLEVAMAHCYQAKGSRFMTTEVLLKTKIRNYNTKWNVMTMEKVVDRSMSKTKMKRSCIMIGKMVRRVRVVQRRRYQTLNY